MLLINSLFSKCIHIPFSFNKKFSLKKERNVKSVKEVLPLDGRVDSNNSGWDEKLKRGIPWLLLKT